MDFFFFIFPSIYLIIVKYFFICFIYTFFLNYIVKLTEFIKFSQFNNLI
jgi:hypothetical protein